MNEIEEKKRNANSWASFATSMLDAGKKENFLLEKNKNNNFEFVRCRWRQEHNLKFCLFEFQVILELVKE